MDEWIKKMWYIYTMRYCSAKKKKKKKHFHLERPKILSEINHIEKDKYCMISLI